ncbi:MAG: hypothetical protein R3Y21_03515 [Mycoplasmatota bacterium]
MNIQALLLTFIAGLILGLVSYLVLKYENKKLLSIFIALQLGIILFIVLDLIIPEAATLIGKSKSSPFNYIVVASSFLLGYYSLKLLTNMIKIKVKKSYKEISEIALVSTITLVFYNTIEGIDIYKNFIKSITSGININLIIYTIPFIAIISIIVNKIIKDNKKTIIITSLIASSTVLGAILKITLQSFLINYNLGILNGISAGLFTFVALEKFIPYLKKEKEKKDILLAFLSGVILSFIISFI